MTITLNRPDSENSYNRFLHDLCTNPWWDEAIYLDAGMIKKQGKPADVVEAYTKETL